jgi:hypothetical protein
MAPAKQGPGHTIVWTSAVVALTVVLAVSGFVVRNRLPFGTDAAQPNTVVSADPVPTPFPELATSGRTLTEKAARDLARTWYERRDHARFTNDDGALAGLDTGDAYRVDLGTSEQIRCGCTPPKHEHVLASVRVVVPKPPVTAFAAQFSVTTLAGVPGTYTVVLVAEPDGWRAAVITLEETPHVALEPPARPHAQGNPVTARKLLNQFGKYLEAARETRRVPRSPHAVWKGIGPSEAAHAAAEGQDATARGIRHHSSRLVATPAAFSIQTAAGELICGTLDQTIDLTASHGGLHQDKGRHNWGRSIAPGNYAGLTTSFAYHVCLTVQPDGARVVSALYGSKLGIEPTSNGRPV